MGGCLYPNMIRNGVEELCLLTLTSVKGMVSIMFLLGSIGVSPAVSSSAVFIICRTSPDFMDLAIWCPGIPSKVRLCTVVWIVYHSKGASDDHNAWPSKSRNATQT